MVEGQKYGWVTPGAIGFSCHSGWAAAVVIAGELGAPAVVERRRSEFADRSLAGSVQPYHAVQKLALSAAEVFIQRCRHSSQQLARNAIAELVASVTQRGFQLVTAAVLIRRKREPVTLQTTLSSHALIHTAEGEFFREILLQTCNEAGLQAVEIPEKQLIDLAVRTLRMPATRIASHVAVAGKTIGPPWQQDHKHAMLAGWIALAKSQVPIHS